MRRITAPLGSRVARDGSQSAHNTPGDCQRICLENAAEANADRGAPANPWRDDARVPISRVSWVIDRKRPRLRDVCAPAYNWSLLVDLNDLLARHQTSLMRANAAACVPSRRAHEGMASAYAARVNALHEDFGASARLGLPRRTVRSRA